MVTWALGITQPRQEPKEWYSWDPNAICIQCIFLYLSILRPTPSHRCRNGGGSGGKCPHTFYELSIGISFLQYKCGLLQCVCPHTFDQLPALLPPAQGGWENTKGFNISRAGHSNSLLLVILLHMILEYKVKSLVYVNLMRYTEKSTASSPRT